MRLVRIESELSSMKKKKEKEKKKKKKILNKLQVTTEICLTFKGG